MKDGIAAVNILMTIGTPDFTGASRIAWMIARAIKAAGHRIIVVTGRRPPEGVASVIDELRLVDIETIEEAGFERRVPDRDLINRISVIVKQEGVQCLISETQQDLKIMVFVAKQTGVRLIYHAQNRVLFSNSWLVRLVKQYLYTRLIRRHVSKVICISDYLRLQHVRDFHISESMVVTINNGVDMSRFAPLEPSTRDRIRAEFGVSKNQLLFLNIGRLTYQKGQDLLLRALGNAELAGVDYKLVFIGAKTVGLEEDNTYEQDLHGFAAAPSLNGKCVFAGWRDDIPALLLSADAYLHSANFEGGVPLAVLEAMAAGLPTVATDCAGTLPGFTEGTHGFVAKTGDEPSLRRNLEELLQLSESRRLEMGREAAKLIRENFDCEVTTRRFVEAVTKPTTPLSEFTIETRSETEVRLRHHNCVS